MHSRPSIDHGALSPSGRASKRTKAEAVKRASLALFGPNGLQRPDAKQETERGRLLRQAQEFRALALRGMKPKAYLKKAQELETQAEKLINQEPHAQGAGLDEGDTP